MALSSASEGVSPSGFVVLRRGCGEVASRLCGVVTSPAPVPHTLINAIVDNIVEKKQVMIRGTVRTGKSFSCKRMAELGYKVVFVCPTKAVSINNFLVYCLVIHI